MATSIIMKQCFSLARFYSKSQTRTSFGQVGNYINFPSRNIRLSAVLGCDYIPVQREKPVITEECEVTKSVINKVNHLIKTGTEGKLFAVIQVCGKQFKVTCDDIIVVEGNWAPDAGDKIRLEKVLLLGSRDFTLVGRPILSLDEVEVHATIIEKSMSYVRTNFLFRKRQNISRIQLNKKEMTYIRINSIRLLSEINVQRDVQEVDGRIF